MKVEKGRSGPPPQRQRVTGQAEHPPFPNPAWLGFPDPPGIATPAEMVVAVPAKPKERGNSPDWAPPPHQGHSSTLPLAPPPTLASLPASFPEKPGRSLSLRPLDHGTLWRLLCGGESSGQGVRTSATHPPRTRAGDLTSLDPSVFTEKKQTQREL